MKNLIAPVAAALIAVAPMAAFAQDADTTTVAPASETTVLVGPELDAATSLAIGLGGLLLVGALAGGGGGGTTTTTTTTTTP